MTGKFFAGIAALLMLATIPAAYSQYEDDKPSKIGIRLTNYMPQSQAARELKSIWMGPAFDYHLTYDKSDKPTSYLSLCILSCSGSNDQSLSENQLTYTRLHRFGNNENRSTYIGYGAGFYQLNYDLRGWNQSKIQPGIHALVGKEFNDCYFAEFRTDLIPSWRNMQWSGISLNIGTRISL